MWDLLKNNCKFVGILLSTVETYYQCKPIIKIPSPVKMSQSVQGVNSCLIIQLSLSQSSHQCYNLYNLYETSMTELLAKIIIKCANTLLLGLWIIKHFVN